MTDQLFYRSGALFAGTPSAAGGKPVTISPKRCTRCGGAGRSDKWAYTGYTCFDCNGAGTKGTQTDRLYTAAELAKLNARQAKTLATRQAKADAEQKARQAEADARREQFQATYADILPWLSAHARDENGDYLDTFLGSLLRQADHKAEWSPAQADAARQAMQRETERARIAAQSRHVGTVGQRLAGKIVVERVASFERAAFGYRGIEVVYIVTMRDDDGNALVVKSPNAYGFTKGETYTIRGTVKDHDSYRGECQTVLNRVTIVEGKQAGE